MEDTNASPVYNLSFKEYWEKFYLKELENFDEYGDEGDIWFGKKNIERIVNWMLRNNVDKLSPVLDVGCGNGLTLVALGEKGYTNLTGIDYAKEAIQLAENVAKNNSVIAKFQVNDFLCDEARQISSQEFHIIIDKGTYDAISLCPVDAKNKRLQYLHKVRKLLSSKGYYILISCNWTKEELLHHFIDFTLYDEIEIPSIGFAGKTGQTVTAVILKKIL